MSGSGSDVDGPSGPGPTCCRIEVKGGKRVIVESVTDSLCIHERDPAERAKLQRMLEAHGERGGDPSASTGGSPTTTPSPLAVVDMMREMLGKKSEVLMQNFADLTLARTRENVAMRDTLRCSFLAQQADTQLRVQSEAFDAVNVEGVSAQEDLGKAAKRREEARVNVRLARTNLSLYQSKRSACKQEFSGAKDTIQTTLSDCFVDISHFSQQYFESIGSQEKSEENFRKQEELLNLLMTSIEIHSNSLPIVPRGASRGNF